MAHFSTAYAVEIQNTEKIKLLNDGETLLLRPKVGKVIYQHDIYAINNKGQLYYSLIDVIDILELAINFDEKQGIGKGWFLREDWKISIDLNQKQITSKGVNYTLQNDDVIKNNNVYFIKQDVLTKIFDMKFYADISQQYLEIESQYPLPGVARHLRQTKKSSTNKINDIAKLPRKKIEYDWLDLNTADIRLRSRYRKADDADSTVFRSGTAAVEGQLLKHDAYAIVSADNDENLTNITARLSKRNENPVLLGPLKARSYTIGDTSLTDIPLTGTNQQELGFRVSNNKLNNSQFQTTDINGDALPGWDVELYRSGVLVGNLIVDDDGFYQFSDVELFAGNNDFELLFYGTQGEVRRRELQIPVTSALLATQDGTYDISVSFSETSTFEKNRNEDIDRETPHFAARYNKTIGKMLTYLGVRNRDIEGENKTFVGAGFTHLINNTIVDGNFGIDDNANTAAELILRKNINDWNLSLSSLLQSDEYIADETLNPTVFRVSGNAQKSFIPAQGQRATVFANARYSETADDRSAISGNLGTSYQKGRFNFSNNLSYQDTEQFNGESIERLDNTVSVRANYGKAFLRAGFDYDIRPDSQIDRYFSQINYYPNNKLSGEARFDYEPDQDFSSLRLAGNYTNKYYRSSPFVEVDNDGEVIVGLNMNFNIIDTPSEAKPLITSDRSVGRGLVSSFVFHDKNGNNLYDSEDTPLPDVVVESVNIKRRAITNSSGHSLINDLPTSRATDIQLDNFSLPDPYMIAATEGVSILPNAGEIVELAFPVHMSGEIDGTVYLRDKEGNVNPLKRATIILQPLSNEKTITPIKVSAAFDGFYVASQIPPGQYLISVSKQTAQQANAALPMPKLVTIGYDGDVLYGLDFELNQEHANIPTEIIYDDNISSDILYAIMVRPQTKLLRLVSQLQSQTTSSLYAGLETIRQKGNGEIVYKLPYNKLEDSYKKCKELSKNAIPCSVQVYVPSESVEISAQ